LTKEPASNIIKVSSDGGGVMFEVYVDPGICGLKSTIRVDAGDMEIRSIDIETDCPYIKEMGPELQGTDGFTECFQKFDTSKVYEIASRHCRHLACPVPCGIIKGIEAACGLALPKDAAIRIRKV
jgi:hypothetical protein